MDAPFLSLSSRGSAPRVSVTRFFTQPKKKKKGRSPFKDAPAHTHHPGSSEAAGNFTSSFFPTNNSL